MKKQTKLPILILLIIIILTSCNQEEVSVIGDYSSVSKIDEYTLINNKEIKKQNYTVLNFFIKLSNENIEINSLKLSNQDFYWSLPPSKIKIDETDYIGGDNLVLPNQSNLSNAFSLEIFLKDGRLLKKEIKFNDSNIIFNTRINLKNNTLFIINDDVVKTFENIIESSDSNYIIKIYSENKDKTLIFDMDETKNYSMDISEFKNPVKIYIAKKINNNTHGKLYNIK